MIRTNRKRSTPRTVHWMKIPSQAPNSLGWCAFPETEMATMIGTISKKYSTAFGIGFGGYLRSRSDWSIARSEAQPTSQEKRMQRQSVTTVLFVGRFIFAFPLRFRARKFSALYLNFVTAFRLPNVRDEPRRDLARGVPFVTRSFQKPFLHDS